MVRAIITWSLHNRFLVLLGTIALIALGVHSALDLNVEAYPDPTPPLVEVITQNPGASPEEMERLIGIPLETALNGMPGLEDLRSTSIAGLNDIKCQFAYGTDYAKARQEVINRIGAVGNLPPGVIPQLSPWSPTGEIVRYVLEGPGYTVNQLKAVQDWVVNRALKQVPGVIDVTGYGGTIKQYQVLLDTQLMKRYGVSLRRIEDAIAQSNANVGGDVLSLGTQAHNVRALGYLGEAVDSLEPANADQAYAIEIEKLEDLKDVVVASNNYSPIMIRHLAKVIVGNRPRLGVVGRGDENDVVEGIVLMRKYEKSLPTAEAVARKMKAIQASGLLPRGMKLSVFNQRTDLVHVTTHNVLHNLVVGMGLVVVVLFVFLGDLISAGIVAMIIPLALLFSVTVLYYQGKSANLLSIGAVDFGIIVDSSVIIVENIHRHLTSSGGDSTRSLIDRIIDASHEIEKALFFSTLIIICAFIPLFSMSGPEGALFGPMASTYAFAIFGALLLAVTLTPVLCSFFFQSKKEEHETLVDRVMKYRYLKALTRILNHRYILLVGMAVFSLATLALIPQLGAEFMPELEEGNLWIRALLPRTVTREEAARMAPRLREVIASVPEIRGVMSHVGRPDDGTDVISYFNLEFNAPLIPMDQWRARPMKLAGYELWSRKITREEIQDELTEKFKDFPGLDFNFSQLIRDNVEEALSGVKGANSVKLFGGDLKTLEEAGQRVVRILSTVRGVENAGLFHILGQPNLEIRINRQECARYGINVADVESVVQVAVGGHAFTQMVEGEKLYDIVLRLPRSLRDDPEMIGKIPVETPGGGDKPAARIPLSQLAEIVPHRTGATYIYRENNRRFIPIKFGVRDRDLSSTIVEAQRKINDPKTGAQLPKGYEIEWSGEFQQMQEANERLAWIVPVSIALIMILLYTAFNSIKDALLVMVNVVEAAMGGIWALWLTGTPFSISAAVGFISVFGVAVQDGVLLISYFNQLRAEGLPVREAVLRGAELRVRPVVMTSLTAALGLFPAAIATSIGSQAQRPLAIVVVGAMLITLLLTRYVMPVLYTFFPAPRGSGQGHSDLIAGSHYTDMFLNPAAPANHRDHAEPSTDPNPNGRSPGSQNPRGPRGMNWKLFLFLLLISGMGAVALVSPRTRNRAARAWTKITSSRTLERLSPFGQPAHASPVKKPPRFVPRGEWDGTVSLNEAQRKAIGVKTVKVEEQTKPTPLKLVGMTDYDPATLTLVRTQFDSRVERVIVDLGDSVKIGDPLIELFSNTLAEAKSAYETASNQWMHDKKVLDYKLPLTKEGSLPRKEMIEIEHNEAQSRLAMKLAKDKLLVFGLNEQEIERAKSEDGTQKAKMILRAQGSGIVIKRSVVRGNFYSTQDDLMVLAPLDHLWVRGYVNEIDADHADVNQTLRVIFPYANETYPGKVEHIDRAIDPDTRSAQLRTTIQNTHGRLKSGMFVRVILDLPPVAGQTVIPRIAMVTLDGENCVFIKKPGTEGDFERRVIIVEHENSDTVIVDEPSKDHQGLQPGEEVVTNGSLILEQAYEDRVIAETGGPS
ncbi:CusA/CzcA family heavy metal efflux RND transporter [Singulisphaera sp. PoT]|uniref:CusA/CzcA family heavy metal efflux RND transporter n=1 Tax=Singulisphaera sp. PoT TaxID=3411797 RepID=UPI003BF51E10